MTPEHIPYKRKYRMRVFKGNVAVSVPPDVIRKEAEKAKLTIEEFIEQFCLIAQYNNFEGIHYQFKRSEEDNG